MEGQLETECSPDNRSIEANFCAKQDFLFHVCNDHSQILFHLLLPWTWVTTSNQTYYNPEDGSSWFTETAQCHAEPEQSPQWNFKTYMKYSPPYPYFSSGWVWLPVQTSTGIQLNGVLLRILGNTLPSFHRSPPHQKLPQYLPLYPGLLRCLPHSSARSHQLNCETKHFITNSHSHLHWR